MYICFYKRHKMSSRLFRIVRASRQGALTLHRSICLNRTVSTKILQNKQFPLKTNYSYSQIRGMCKSANEFESFNVQDAADFEKRVLESSVPVVVDFHASWCGPCKILVPTVLGVKNGKIQDRFVGLKEDDLLNTFVEKLIN
ncbi:hypothetical protein KUTeg_004591 [Tegillarca granosa]|uniref:Thioredoxin domain-containing protein n=1 Tax=Tegillarca granosa TaxID=220873 RepID=A0ABQ9FUV1_TEGGR|nr:hypothetical protein KUTeg_004591 [Tegillarca granosa]